MKIRRRCTRNKLYAFRRHCLLSLGPSAHSEATPTTKYPVALDTEPRTERRLQTGFRRAVGLRVRFRNPGRMADDPDDELRNTLLNGSTAA